MPFFFQPYQDRFDILETQHKQDIQDLKVYNHLSNETLQLLAQEDLQFNTSFQNLNIELARHQERLDDLDKEILPNKIW